MAKSKEENVNEQVKANVNAKGLTRYKVDFGNPYSPSLVWAKNKEHAVKKYLKMINIPSADKRIPLVNEYTGDVNIFADIQEKWKRQEEGIED